METVTSVQETASSTSANVGLTVIASIFTAVAIVANCQMLYVFFTHPGLRMFADQLLLNLTVADSLIALIAMPVRTHLTFTGARPWSSHGCFVVLLVESLLMEAAAFCLLMMAYHHETLMQGRNWDNRHSFSMRLLLLAAPWIAALTVISVPLVRWGLSSGESHKSNGTCTFPLVEELVFLLLQFLTESGVLFFACSIFCIIRHNFYIKIEEEVQLKDVFANDPKDGETAFKLRNEFRRMSVANHEFRRTGKLSVISTVNVKSFSSKVDLRRLSIVNKQLDLVSSIQLTKAGIDDETLFRELGYCDIELGPPTEKDSKPEVRDDEPLDRVLAASSPVNPSGLLDKPKPSSFSPNQHDASNNLLGSDASLVGTRRDLNSFPLRGTMTSSDDITTCSDNSRRKHMLRDTIEVDATCNANAQSDNGEDDGVAADAVSAVSSNCLPAARPVLRPTVGKSFDTAYTKTASAVSISANKVVPVSWNSANEINTSDSGKPLSLPSLQVNPSSFRPLRERQTSRNQIPFPKQEAGSGLRKKSWSWAQQLWSDDESSVGEYTIDALLTYTEDMKGARMIFLLCAALLVCSLPVEMIDLIRLTVRVDVSFQVLTIFYWLHLVLALVNPIVVSQSHPTFKKALIELLQKLRVTSSPVSPLC